MNGKKRELVLKASDIYMTYGIKSITMEEMARQLGVSKKTLYLYVKDKNELVEQCVLAAHEEEEVRVQEIIDSTENAIEEMVKISRLILEELRQIHPSIFFDLERYHPSVISMIDQHKNQFVRGCIEQNMVQGIEQGLYRKNLNANLISSIYIGMMDSVMSGAVQKDSKLKPDELYSELFRYHIRGIANEVGLEYLVELVKNDDYL